MMPELDELNREHENLEYLGVLSENDVWANYKEVFMNEEVELDITEFEPRL